MSAFLREWIMGLVAAAILASVAQILTPKGAVEKVIKFVCAMMLGAVLLSPVLDLNVGDIGWSMEEYRETISDLTTDIETQQNAMIRTYIEDQCAAYILDEAQQLGIADGSVEVRAKWEANNCLPREAAMTMNVTSEQKNQLSLYIATQLGIPTERQQWHDF